MRSSPAVAGDEQAPRAGSAARMGLTARPAGATLALGLILVVGLVHGLVYVFLMPPWQHYDEPNHFEYVWLVAHRPGLPQPGDFDRGMRQAVADSMRDHQFFRGFSPPAVGGSQDAPAWIGDYPQLDEPPLFYLLASLPLRVLPSADITTQLYAARFVSLFLFLTTLWAAWGVTAELLPPGHPLRWAVPMSIALLPGFVDLMTAVNNDVGAVAIFSVFLWGSARLVRRGFSLLDALWAIIAAASCVFTKSTAMLALPLLALALLLAGTRRRWRVVAWGFLAVGIIAGLVLVLAGDDAGGWYRSTLQPSAVRATVSPGGTGEQAIRLDFTAPVSPSWVPPLFQPFSLDTGQELQGKVVTLGAWLWADRPIDARTPELHQANTTFSKKIRLTQDPAFFAFSVQLVEGYPRIWISLNPVQAASNSKAVIYMDGLVLAEGVRPEEDPPEFSTPQAQAGDWGGKPFVNLIRNGSAENAGLRFKPWVDRLGAKILPDHTLPSLILTSLMDWKNTGWFYWQVTVRLFRTFWGQFGWGHVPLLGYSPYRTLGYLCLLLALGAAIGLVRLRRKLPVDVLIFLGAGMIAVWLAAFLRTPSYMSTVRLFLPVARYAYPAIIPTMFIFTLGGWSLLQVPGWVVRQGKARQLILEKSESQGGNGEPARQPASQIPAIVWIVLFVLLDIYSILSILAYY